MRTTWTFYPRGQEPITLTILYIPELDQHPLPQGGFLHTDTNTAYVNWQTYRLFDTPDVESRRQAFQRLTRIDDPEMNLEAILQRIHAD
ncbi:hypothetical protein GCM10023189_50450 [Nibrella saemangeumensis]|uniref:Uncharacterized protein n=1 Tax=Nibrella saemangeumensis TaxID=1084526 RepID=A0ABP8NL26_9BACT